MDSKRFRIPILIIVLVVGIVLGIEIENIFSDDSLRDSIQKFNEVLTYTEKYYVEEVDTPHLVESAINGMLSDLDPHSIYIPAKELTGVEESFRGDFDGIGIEFQVVNDTLTVVSPITGGPSEALGILPGDRIVKIEDKNCIGITNEEVREKLRGKAGTKVKVSIKRNSVEDLIDFEITRDKIPLYSVDTHLMLKNNTGYVSVSRFSETTFDELSSALQDLKKSGMQQLVLDLRGNPGGYLQQAVDIADLFIKGKKKIVYTKGRRSELNEDFFAEKTYPYEDIPLIVLINQGSASASEIVAGAIQDWDRGLIVGETSFGKGLVQKQFTLPDNSAFRLTISDYFTPSGRLIQRDYKNKKNKDEYYAEVSERDEKEGNNIEHTEEEDSTKPVFKTSGGRIVYGGGGITPDYIVKLGNLTEYSRNLLKQNLFYQYTLNFLETNGNNIAKKYGDDLSKFNDEFKLTENEISKFIDFAKTKGVEFSKKDFEIDKNYITVRLKAQVARNYWKNEGWYSVMLLQDDQLQKALTLFDEAKQLAELKH
jgi:carboxyl-terminal processing protease